MTPRNRAESVLVRLLTEGGLDTPEQWPRFFQGRAWQARPGLAYFRVVCAEMPRGIRQPRELAGETFAVDRALRR